MRYIKITLLFVITSLTTYAQTFCDVLIKNGKIIDGTGNNWFYGDVAIKDGKILDVGRSLQYITDKTIDASGLIVAPGFIDVHTHIEGDDAKNPTADNFIYDGVTTVIAGNCGSSNVQVGKYLNWVDSFKLSINVATLIGHNDVRRAVMGRANRDATPEELQKMEALVEKAMQEGAVGLSTGLIYIPGTYAKTSEILALAKVAAKYNGIYASHIRNVGRNNWKHYQAKSALKQVRDNKKILLLTAEYSETAPNLKVRLN